MTSPPSNDPRRWVAVFDLDGTLTWHDTLMPFLASFLRRHPGRWFGLWRSAVGAAQLRCCENAIAAN